MNKPTALILLILTLILTACSGSTSGPASSTQSGSNAGALSTGMQMALGTIKLDETENAVTAEQAKDLLPLWQTLEVLYSSDTAATQEIDALVTQIQDTMTSDQAQAITALNLTRQDMMSIMQEQGLAMGGANAQNGGAIPNNGSGFRPDGGEMPGGMPPGGGFPDGGGGFQGQNSRNPSSTSSTDTTTRPTTMDPNRVPTPLVSAVIEYLKKKAGA